MSPSPRSSPCGVGDGSRHRDTDMETDEDMFFGPDSSFILNVTSDTPSPQSKTTPPAPTVLRLHNFSPLVEIDSNHRPVAFSQWVF